MQDDNKSKAQVSDNDDGSFTKDEDGRDYTISRSATGNGIVGSPATKQSSSGLHSHTPMEGLPMRTQHQFQQQSIPDTSSHSSAFVDVSGVSVQNAPTVGGAGPDLTLEMGTAPRNPHRRTSGFTDYTGPGGGNIYSQSHGWTMDSSPQYGYATHQHNPQTSSFDGQGLPMDAQPFMQPSFNEDPARTTCNSQSPTGMPRSVDINHQGIQTHQPGYRF